LDVRRAHISAGCVAFWMWLRQGKSVLWLAPGVLSLVLLAWLLSLVPSQHARRAYAAYGGIYIVVSLLWLWVAEGQRPIDGISAVALLRSWRRRSSFSDPEAPSLATLTPVSHMQAFEHLARGDGTSGEL
jgi:drug/metabolite transporter superfamily protein YnfA